MNNDGHIHKITSDTGIGLLLIGHIDHPCVEPTTGQNLREFYLREAKRVLPQIQNPDARSLLDMVIKGYENK